MSQSDTSSSEQFLHHGGECGALLRAVDWAHNPLGPPAAWPQSLKTSVSIVLNSGYPMFIWWGHEHITLYNDAYIGMIGKKHPHFLGRPAAELWAEVWEESLLPLADTVLKEGKSIYRKNLLLLLERNGYPEENYFSFSYSPIIDEKGEVGGLFCACHEETQNLLERRRLQNLTTIGGRLMNARTLTDIGSLTVEKLNENPNDVPFALFYLIDEHNEAVRAASSGIPETELERAFPAVIRLDSPSPECPVRTVIQNGLPMVAGHMDRTLPPLPHFFTSQKPTQAYIQPIRDGQGRFAAVLVTGISPLHDFGYGYRNYFETVATKISTAIRTVNTLRVETEARKKIEESHQKFREMVLGAPMGIAVLGGPHFVVEIVNDAYLGIVDRTRENFENRPLFEGLPELKDQQVEMLLKEVLATGKPFYGNEFEIELVRDGKRASGYFNFVYKPVVGPDGHINNILVVATDVTDMVKARHAIQESETYFRRMADSVPMMIWITRKDGSCTYLNRQWYEYTGQDTEAALGRGWLNFTHPDDKKHLSDTFAEAIAAQKSFGVEYRLRSKGSYRWVSSVALPRFGPTGLFEGYIGTITDINDRKIVEEKIKESEERSRLAIDAAELGTYEWIIDSSEIHASRRFMYIFGYEWTDPVDRNRLIDRIHPEDRGIHHAAHLEAETTGILSYEARVVWDNRSVHWIKIKGKIVYDDVKGAKKMLGTVMDITEQKVSLAAMKESELRYRQLIEGLPVAVYTVDSAGRIKLYNEAAVNLWGRVPEDGKETWCGSYGIYNSAGEWVSHEHSPMATALGENRTLTAEIMVQRPSGEIRHVLVHPQPIQDMEGNPSGAINAMVDITDLKRFEQALKTSESRLSEAQRIAGIGNWEYGYTDKAFYCSDEVYRILGTSSRSFVPTFHNLFRIIHPQDIKKLSRTLSFTRRSKLPFNIDFRIITENGIVKYINSQGYVVPGPDGRIVKIIGTLQDITARKIVEEELIEAKRVSEKTLRYKEQFLANMSHEIRTPMNAIVGFTELLLKTRLLQEQKQYIDAIKISGENLLVIINDILDFSKLEAGAIHFEHIDFRLSEVVSTLTDLMLPKSVEKGIKLSVNISPSIPDILIGDPTRLNQVLLNLVGNAIKFTEKGEVKISAVPVNDYGSGVEVKFSVADTGIGIEENLLDFIFDVFTQTSSDTTRKYGGSGLGLAIVKQFVEKQGGKVAVESRFGEGSVFSFTLSFEKSAETMAKKEKPAHEPVNRFAQESLKILLVEDNKLNQLLASKALSDWNWRVEIADNGLIALDKLKQGDFDVVLMDIQLPEMDGYEATRYIRTTFDAPKCHVPIIAVTAHAMQSEAKKCHDAGMNGYISKPFSPKMLYEGIMDVLETSRKNVSQT